MTQTSEHQQQQQQQESIQYENGTTPTLTPTTNDDDDEPESSTVPQQQQQEEEEEEEEGNGGDDKIMSLEEILYSTASFHAIVKPVTLTMILTATCVVVINTPETLEASEEQLSNSYVAFDIADEDASTVTKVAYSVSNALIIVSVICAMTFVIVLLYKYRCIKLLLGYMIVASAALLGLLGGNLFLTAINIYQLAVDVFSYYYSLWNFALVGTAAIFWPFGKAFPTWTTQGYLIATSVILAWQLAALDPWTSWALLVVLALYDLCAVLTPCGPLKALVTLMSREDSPDMPGLLYEAELPLEAQRPSSTARHQQQSSRRRRRQRVTTAQHQESTEMETTASISTSIADTALTTTTIATTLPTIRNRRASTEVTQTEQVSSKHESQDESLIVDGDLELTTRPMFQLVETNNDDASTTVRIEEVAVSLVPSPPSTEGRTSPISIDAFISSTDEATTTAAATTRPTAVLPFAIAKLYKLPLESEEPERRPSLLLADDDDDEEELSPNELLARLYTPEQLTSQVVAIFPRNGGRIDVVDDKYYIVKDRHGNVRRTLLMDDQGRILEHRKPTPEEERQESRRNNSIKLGLGDFIFYSVLVSKAALYSFTTFVACMLVVLTGLGLTLVLLAVYHKALPALPISIFMGVIFYLLTRALIEPWFQAVLITPYYV